MNILASLEASGLSMWLRESESIWAYPTILTLHTVGLAVLVGASSAFSLRLLGFAKAIPLATFEPSFRVMWIGFWVNLASGIALLVAEGQWVTGLAGVALGALLYTVINSPGYYADRAEWGAVAMFMIFIVLAVAAITGLVLS